MKLRSLLITIIALFAMVLGGVAAQDMPMMDTCFNLSAEDCAVIDEANANGIGDASSFTIEIDIAFTATGIPDETMSSVDFNMSGAINVNEDMEAMLPINAGGSFEITSELLGPPMSVEFAVVDDFLYALDPTSGEWMGIDVIALMESEEFSAMFEGLMSGDVSALGMGDMPDMESLMPLLAILEVPGLMTYERDGNDFIFTIDLSVLGNPENAELLAEIDAAIAEVDPSMEGMAMMVPMMLNAGTIEIVQSVNTELNIVDNIQFNVHAEVSEMMTGGTEPVVVDLAVNVALTNLDSAPTAEAPAEFTDMTDSISGMAAGAGQ